MNPEISRTSHHRRQSFSAWDIGLKSEFFIIVKTAEQQLLVFSLVCKKLVKNISYIPCITALKKNSTTIQDTLFFIKEAMKFKLPVKLIPQLSRTPKGHNSPRFKHHILAG